MKLLTVVLGGVFATIIFIVGVEADEPGQLEPTTLQPGDNYVGWVSAPISVDNVFAAIPEAALIYTWDADRRSWRWAIRGVGGPLETLEPGMAAMIRINGTRSVQWQRPLTPAKGMVTLYRGVNWVTWVGRDDWPLDQVARGIGTSLVSIRVGDETWPAPLDSSVDELPTLRRGDALQVTVSRDLRWLQPTGMPAKIVWIGAISQSLRDTITDDAQHIVDYFGEKLGVETDFSDTTILIWKGVEAAVEYQDSGQWPHFDRSGEALRVFLEHNAPGGAKPLYGMFYSASNWEPPCPHVRDVRRHCGIDQLAHEWFHYLQWQIGNQTFADAPEWMSEGAAIWGGDMGLLVADGQQSFSQTREEYRQDAARTTVTLQSSEERNTPWQYRLGALAVDLLVERAGLDAVVEYYRQMHQQPLESDRRYAVATDWPEAFRNAFGITVEDFYEEFEAWRGELSHEGPRYDYYRGDRTLRGSLKDADGNPATGYWINTEPRIGENKSGRIRRTHIRDDGTFSIDLVPNTTQRLWITHDGCTLWLTDDGLATTRPDASEHRLLDTRNLPRLNLMIPAGVCGEANGIEVEVLRLRGDDRSVVVGVRSESGFTWGSRTSSTLSLPASGPGTHQIMFRVGGCDLWYASGGLVASREEADPIELGDAIKSLEVRIPHDLCVRQISGRLTHADGAPISRVWLTASGDGMSGGTHQGANGEFTITVPDSGSYQLSFAVNGCRIYYGASGATTNWRQVTRITVADSDVTGIEFVVPNDPASVCN